MRTAMVILLALDACVAGCDDDDDEQEAALQEAIGRLTAFEAGLVSAPANAEGFDVPGGAIERLRHELHRLTYFSEEPLIELLDVGRTGRPWVTASGSRPPAELVRWTEGDWRVFALEDLAPPDGRGRRRDRRHDRRAREG